MASKAAKKRTGKAMSRKAVGRSTKKASKSASSKSAGRPPRVSSGYAVFVSHSSKEAWIAGQIAKEVRALGADSWIDVNNLRGGDVFQEEIMEAIRNCTEAIVIVSPSSVSSQWVSFEIGAVAVQGKRVTPILNNVPPNKLGPLRGMNAIDLNNLDDYLEQLKERVRQNGRGGRR